jgi:signal transduction histidine kinase
MAALRHYFAEQAGRLGLVTEVEIDKSLQQHQRMEALGRMASEVAHDFGNLLTVILGYSELLEPELPDAGEAAVYLSEIRRAAQQASVLTCQLLSFGRHSRAVVAPVDLAVLVQGMGGLLRPLLGKSVELASVAGPDAGRVRADPKQLEQVVVNLVINARDALPFGGRIDLAVEAIDLSGPLAHAFGEVPPGAYVRLTVRDNGLGMDEQTLSQLFRPFFTTKAQGTGLGLAIVARVVRQSGGHVVVRSTLGRGTTFEIYLPRLI